jgi:hypothetical protein
MTTDQLGLLVTVMHSTRPTLGPPERSASLPCLAGIETPAEIEPTAPNKANLPRSWPENAGGAQKQTQFGVRLVAPKSGIVCADLLSPTCPAMSRPQAETRAPNRGFWPDSQEFGTNRLTVWGRLLQCSVSNLQTKRVRI